MKLARHHFSPVRPLAALVLAVASVAAETALPPPVPDTLDLKTAISFALENNFAIRQAKERIRQQEGLIIEVKARGIPNAELNSTYGRFDRSLAAVPLPIIPVNTESWSIGLNVTQVLYAGGGVRSAIQSSKLAREAAILDLQAVINDALLEVRTGFFRVLLAIEQIKVQESNLELLQQQLKTATDRYEAGTVSSFEKLRAEVAVANARVPLITARNDHRLAIEALRQALGFTTNAPETIRKVPTFVGTLDFTPVNFDLPAAFDAARANRPDLQRLAKITAVREQDVRTQRSSYYPTLGASAGYQFKNHPYGGNQFSEALDGWTLGLQSNWAIFDGRATAGRVAQSKSILAQTKLTLAEAQLAVDVEVRRAFSQWQQATELVEASQKVVDQATEAVRLANARYNAGTGTQLDVLQAQVDLTTARTNQIVAFYNYNVAVASLRKATGLLDEFVTK
ncbi:MAG: TolC family protein [Opitutaceae bacterium]|nr:TolC family protein [Opitutaceae bacterium]